MVFGFGFSYPFFAIEFHPFSVLSSLFYVIFSWKSSVSFIVIVVVFNTEVVSFYFTRWCIRLVFFSIIWILRRKLVLIIRCSSWLTISDNFILISLRCFHRLWSSILKGFITLLWIFLDVLFNIPSHLRCNCLSLVHKAKLNLMFRPFGYFSFLLYVVKKVLCNNNVFIFSSILNSDVSTCFTIFVKDQFQAKMHRLSTITLLQKSIKKRWLTNFTVDDLIDAYMVFFPGNL